MAGTTFSRGLAGPAPPKGPSVNLETTTISWMAANDRPQGELHMRRALEDSLSLLAGVGVGTALMYLLDPDNGADRRERVADSTRQAVGTASEAMSGAGHRIADTARSAW